MAVKILPLKLQVKVLLNQGTLHVIEVLILPLKLQVKVLLNQGTLHVIEVLIFLFQCNPTFICSV